MGRRSELPTVTVGDRFVRVRTGALEDWIRRRENGRTIRGGETLMACIRQRRGKWVLDYRDGAGRRRWETFETKGAAEDRLAVVLPALGTFKVRRLHRGAIKTLLAEKQAQGLAPDSVRLIHAALRRMLNAAVEDDVIRTNPASGLGRVLRLSRSKSARGESIRAFDADQLRRFLDAAESKTPRFHPLFLLMARSGLRLGEALALQWRTSTLNGESCVSSAP